LEWKDLKKNEIKCIGASSASAPSNEPKCPPVKKLFKKYWSSAVDESMFSCGGNDWDGTCKMTCPGTGRPTVPKFKCTCKKGKCKSKDIKKVKKFGLACQDSSRTGPATLDLPVLQCEDPYEKFGDKFAYDSRMECTGIHPEASCSITCPEGSIPNVGLMTCECNFESYKCDWNRSKFIKKRGVQCVSTGENLTEKYLAKIRSRSGK
jgi:hypothetical protein